MPVTRASPVFGFSWNGTPAGERAREAPDVEVVEEPAVAVAVDAELGGVLVGERPPDVVVAAHVVDPRVPGGQRVPALERLLQHPRIARRERLPRERHLQRVVRELALLERDVLDDLVGVHDRLGLEQQARRGHAQHRVERPQQQVRLGQRLARRAERFQMKATASMRRISTPWFARNSISPAIARNTAGFA